MKLPRRTVLQLLPLSATPLSHAAASATVSLFLGRDTICGEVTQSSALLQTRLTSGTALDVHGDLLGAEGVACFGLGAQADFRNAQHTPFEVANEAKDFVLRAELTSLKPNTEYFYRALYGSTESNLKTGPECSFKSLPPLSSLRSNTLTLVVTP
jgi:phosphodiesterase/alkaline phosphatase D-like protein